MGLWRWSAGPVVRPDRLARIRYVVPSLGRHGVGLNGRRTR